MISVEILTPEQDVPCTSSFACGLTVSGSSTGLNDEMQIVLFVNPLDSSLDTWWRYPVTEIDEDGNWQQDVFIREDRYMFAGEEFTMKALILPRELVPVLPRSMDELPEDELGHTPSLSYRTISPRTPLGESRFPGQVTIEFPLNYIRSLTRVDPLTVMGIATGVPDNIELWTLVYVERNGSYFPQNQTDCPKASPAIRTGDAWEAPNIRLGGVGDIQYDIVIIAVESESEESKFFRDYLTNGCRTGDFSGLKANELGITHEEAAITVVAGDSD